MVPRAWRVPGRAGQVASHLHLRIGQLRGLARQSPARVPTASASRMLERDLPRKDCSMAETAALLVLSKKVAAIFSKARTSDRPRRSPSPGPGHQHGPRRRRAVVANLGDRRHRATHAAALESPGGPYGGRWQAAGRVSHTQFEMDCLPLGIECVKCRQLQLQFQFQLQLQLWSGRSTRDGLNNCCRRWPPSGSRRQFRSLLIDSFRAALIRQDWMPRPPLQIRWLPPVACSAQPRPVAQTPARPAQNGSTPARVRKPA